jgi:hypothetical protein
MYYLTQYDAVRDVAGRIGVLDAAVMPQGLAQSTLDEDHETTTKNLEVIYSLVQNMRAAMEGEQKRLIRPPSVEYAPLQAMTHPLMVVSEPSVSFFNSNKLVLGLIKR